jgi:hypothetical protein
MAAAVQRHVLHTLDLLSSAVVASHSKAPMAQHNVGMQSWSDIELCVFGRCAVRVEPREKIKEILCAVFVKTDRETDMVRFMACSSGRDSQHQREARLRKT